MEKSVEIKKVSPKRVKLTIDNSVGKKMVKNLKVVEKLAEEEEEEEVRLKFTKKNFILKSQR